jgi:CBS domain-containing protein
VRDIMENDPSVVKADTPISELAALVQRERRSEIPVVDDLGRFVGVVIVRRFIRQYVSRKERLLSTQA